METHLSTVIIRHRRENLNKCSLRGLESRKDICFLRYPMTTIPMLHNYFVLTIDAPVLTIEDQHRGILLLDATWRYAEKMTQFVTQIPNLQYRSLPSHFKTAYPRRQDDCSNPERGLASIEALYLTYQILGKPTDGLLDHYYWKDNFLNINHLKDLT